MVLPTQATLEYQLTATNVTATQLQTAMGAVVLYTSAANDPVLKGVYDCTVSGDTTSAAGLVVSRTIVLALGPEFLLRFPTPQAWLPAFNGLFRSTLDQKLSARCTEVPALFT